MCRVKNAHQTVVFGRILYDLFFFQELLKLIPNTVFLSQEDERDGNYAQFLFHLYLFYAQIWAGILLQLDLRSVTNSQENEILRPAISFAVIR